MSYSRSNEEGASCVLAYVAAKVGEVMHSRPDIGPVSRLLLSSTIFNDEAAGARGA
jgi:hypothetical protein